MSKFTESDVEEAALYYFEQLGYTVLGGSDIAPDESGAERTSYIDVVLVDRQSHFRRNSHAEYRQD